MSNIENNVMAAVRVIHIGRALVGKTALELYALTLSFAGIATMVSVSSVLQNFALVAGNGVVGIGAFVVAAILKTNILVQVALVLATCSLALLVRDMVQSFSQERALAL